MLSTNEVLLTLALVKYLELPGLLAGLFVAYALVVEGLSLIVMALAQRAKQQKFLDFDNIDESIHNILNECEKRGKGGKE